MLAILSATGPIFIIIAMGYGLFRSGLLPKEGVRVLGGVVLNVALPALIFSSLARRNFTDIWNPTYLAVFAAGTLGTALIIFVISRYAFRQPLTAASIMALGSASANSGFVGYPIAALVVGPPAVVALALCMLIENFISIPLLLMLAEAGTNPDRKPSAVLRSSLAAVLRNPLIIAIAAGAVASILQLRLPGPLEKSVDMLAAASAPIALISIGGALANLSMSRRVGGLALVVFGKLVLHPLLVFLCLRMAPPLDPALSRAVVIFACAPMMTIYPLLGARFGLGQQTASELLVATVLSFLTMSAVIALV